MAIQNNYINYNEVFIGTVMDYNLDTRECAVYIPKIMATLYEGYKYTKEEFTNNGLILPTFKNKMSTKVKKANYIWVHAIDNKQPIPAVGSKVYITFIEGNPEYPIWWKFNPFNYQDYVAEEERHLPIFALNINDTIINVKNDLSYKLDIHDNITVFNEEENKYELYSIYEKDHGETTTDALVRLDKNIQELKMFAYEMISENLESYNYYFTLKKGNPDSFISKRGGNGLMLLEQFEDIMENEEYDFYDMMQSYRLIKKKVKALKEGLDAYVNLESMLSETLGVDNENYTAYLNKVQNKYYNFESLTINEDEIEKIAAYQSTLVDICKSTCKIRVDKQSINVKIGSIVKLEDSVLSTKFDDEEFETALDLGRSVKWYNSSKKLLSANYEFTLLNDVILYTMKK